MRSKRRNFLGTFILIVFFWFLQAFIVFFVEPEIIKDILIPNSYLLFFVNLFLALFFTLAVILGNSRRGLITTIGIIAYLVLQSQQLGNILNLILIISTVLALELYFKQKKS